MKPRHESTTQLPPRADNSGLKARRSGPSVRSKKGIKVELHTTINRPAEELYAFWRNFENLPLIMEHLESVQCLDGTRSHWRVRKFNDSTIEWDAEVINERPHELIAWRTLEGSDVRHAGTIWFKPGPTGMGTEVKLAVEYEASGFADGLAKLFRHSPEQQMREDLRHFKQWMETGEIPTTAGQSAGRTEDKSLKYEEAK